MLPSIASAFRSRSLLGFLRSIVFTALCATLAPWCGAIDAPVSPGAIPAVGTLLNFLDSTRGNYIVSGQQERSWDPSGLDFDVNYIIANTGKTPAVRGFDFLEYVHSPSQRAGETASERAITWAKNGGIVTFCCHMFMNIGSTNGQPQFYTPGTNGNANGTNFDIRQAVIDGTPENIEYLAKLDIIAAELTKLRNAGVPVIWRPFHECGGTWFWWSAHGSTPFVQAYRLMFTRFTQMHGLTNLIWVFNPIDSTSTMQTWYPGDDVVDMIALDTYPGSGTHPAFATESTQMRNFKSGRKVVAMSECGSIPDPDLIFSQGAVWSYFCTWNGFENDLSRHTVTFLNTVYNHPKVLTLESLPTVYVAFPLTFTTQPSSPSNPSVGQSLSLTVATTGSPVPTYRWQRLPAGSSTWANVSNDATYQGATTTTLTISSFTSAMLGDQFRCVATNSVSAVTSNVATITGAAPVISLQPVSQVIAVGNAVAFTTVATGSPTYQWQKNSVSIPGATGSSYSISSAVLGDSGSYTVIATNGVGSVTSAVAVLTVVVPTPPAITTQPSNQTATTGNSVTFTAAASGAPVPTYQWYKNGSSITGATSATLTIATVQVSDAGNYQVVATNSGGSATSVGATLAVYALPVFTTQPLSNAAFVGSSVSMICAVTGTPTPTYQWQKGGMDILGATSSTLTLSNVQLSDAGSYGLVATNAAGSSVTSRFSRLVVLLSQQNAITYATTRSSTGVTAGGIVNFDYFVTNVGTKTWGPKHYLSIRDVNNTFVAFSSLIGILPGETTTANLNFPAPTTPGTYTYYVQGLEDGVEFFSTQTTVVLTVLAPVTNAITYNTTTFPVSAAPGSNVIFTYNVTNTGTATWGANHILSLKNASGTVISSTPLTVLAPGASKTVNLSFTVPSTPGSYNYSVQASQTGVGNFGTQANLTLIALAAQPNAIVYNRVRYPDEVVPGAVLNLKYTLSNAGTQAWGAGHYVSLRDSASNYLAFIPLAGTAVSATKTVEFTLTAPTTPGTYTYYVQALEDGVEFFSTQDVVVITVVALPLGNAVSYNTSTIPVTASPGATVNFTANVTNSGTRTWGATHYLSFRDVDNTFLAFPTLNGVAPGASRTSNLSFTAPTTPGVYTYTLQAFEDGVSFFEMADTVVLLVQ